MGIAAAAVLPGFLGPAGRLFVIPASGAMTLEDYYDHFGVDAEAIQAVIAEALSRGGDYCDVYFEHTMSNTIALEDKAVNRAFGDVDFGVGIRVLKGDQTGYSFTEEITPQAMRLAARTAANIASSGQTVSPVELVLHRTPDYYPIARSWEEVSVDEKIPSVLDLGDRVAALDPRIVKTRIALSDYTSYILLATSEGRVVRDYRPHGEIYASCVAEDKARREGAGDALGPAQRSRHPAAKLVP